MAKYDLSILTPARNEEFVSKTIQDILEHKKGKTEVIVGLDGQWANPPIVDHDDVTILYYPESIGQRAMTNQLCRLSKAKWVMKADAHTAWDDGFDVKMLEAAEELGEDTTLVPVMRNLWCFDWVCEDGHRRYQGRSGVCEECGKSTTKDIVWIGKKSPQSTAYRFDTTLHFQYHNDYKKRQEGDYVETMSLQGSCFMLTREKYWELNICDEQFGSWGQQGTEVACKTWLSGGRVICNRKTWYAHMFRTQGGDFGFPYPQDQKQIDHARQFSRDLFLKDNWPMAKRKFQWLLDKFAPLPGWHDDQVDKDIGDSEIPDNKKGVIFYTDNRLNLKIAHAVQKQLRQVTKGMMIYSSSLKPMTFGDKNVVIDEPRGYKAYFKQIIAALEMSTSEIVFFCEHDVIYPKEHFDFTPPDRTKFYYNQNWWKVRQDGLAVHWDADQVSGLVCYRETALAWYYKKFAEFNRDKFDRKFEPMSGETAESWKSSVPYIDIRHEKTLTKSKWSLDDFRDKRTAKGFESSTIDQIPGWSKEELAKIKNIYAQ